MPDEAPPATGPQRPLPEQFTAIARARPERTAIVHNGHEIGYGALADRVRRAARRLGPRPGRVPVDAVHDPETVVRLLGTWLAGGTYVPIDPAYPAERRAAMLAAVEPAVLRQAGEPAVLRQAGEPAIPRQGGALAYILFTSGSTGVPKPVLTSPAAIATTVGALRDLFGITPDDRVLQFASLNWDTCFEEILPALTAGAALVFDDDAYAGSFPKFVRMLERERITIADLPTAYWHELVNFLVEEDRRLPATLRTVIIGGEAARPARLADWSTLDTGRIRLVNTYGCTETTLITHAVDLCGPLATEAVDWSAATRVPIGRPLPHVVQRIDDETGELWIGGPAIADGYAAPDLAERFTRHDGQRFFRTGDRVRRRDDGVLVHEGRADDVLKIRGVRVDPGEVEAHLAAHPAVGAVAVAGLARGDHTILAAFVVPRRSARTETAAGTGTAAGTEAAAGTETLAADLVQYLKGRVPAHLVPSRISLVAELAYTPSGKVDRRRIKETLA
ncbi:AMP-binding protein [Hamadaea tsunoensis]|uniref:AMP-binding protein n=1 Tax=Hamadaea tsunoensis TaxID=53368 RepID=UPI00041AFA1D|nr:AMP-binding protein [Hamadaea tsunoensis]